MEGKGQCRFKHIRGHGSLRSSRYSRLRHAYWRIGCGGGEQWEVEVETMRLVRARIAKVELQLPVTELMSVFLRRMALFAASTQSLGGSCGIGNQRVRLRRTCLSTKMGCTSGLPTATFTASTQQMVRHSSLSRRHIVPWEA